MNARHERQECETSDTNATWAYEQQECNKTETRVTRVQPEGYANDTCETRVPHGQRESDTSEKC